MAKLFVVPHAPVNVDARIPSTEWMVSNEGMQLTKELALRESWSDVSCIHHSPESKAVDTAKIIADVAGIPLQCMDELRELYMPTMSSGVEFLRRMGEYLSGFRDPEIEDWDLATNRIVQCVHGIVDKAEGRSVAIVSHGRILTAFFSHILGRRLTFDEWRSIRLPDLSVIDLSTWSVEKGFFKGL